MVMWVVRKALGKNKTPPAPPVEEERKIA